MPPPPPPPRADQTHVGSPPGLSLVLTAFSLFRRHCLQASFLPSITEQPPLESYLASSHVVSLLHCFGNSPSESHSANVTFVCGPQPFKDASSSFGVSFTFRVTLHALHVQANLTLMPYSEPFSHQPLHLIISFLELLPNHQSHDFLKKNLNSP